jgi:hypothetical protein
MIIPDQDGIERIDEETVTADLVIGPYDPSKTRIDTDRIALDTLVRRLKNGEIERNNDFQRTAGLWNAGKMSRLIESVLMRIPLPSFYFDGANDDRWLVIDGLQRLSTLHSFVLDPDPKTRLHLQGLEHLVDLEGHTFETLPRPLQRRIEETQVTVHIIRPGTPPEVKYSIFRRINTGGLVLTAQEIRDTLHPGPARAFLQRLARSDSFLRATDGSVSPDRVVDRELVLRFCAFTLISPSKYTQSNLDRYLTSAMELLNKSTEDVRDDLEARFYQAMDAAWRIFGNDAFRKRFEPHAARHPINKALFEPWSFWLGVLSRQDIDALVRDRERVKASHMVLMNEDPLFLEAISQGTGDVAKVRLRFTEIARLIRDILDTAIR